jgi:hypothetical protein
MSDKASRINCGLPFDLNIPADWKYQHVRLVGVDSIIFSLSGRKKIVVTYGPQKGKWKIPYGYQKVGLQIIRLPGTPQIDVFMAEKKPKRLLGRMISVVLAAGLLYIGWNSLRSSGGPQASNVLYLILALALFIYALRRSQRTLKAAFVHGGTEYIFTTHTDEISENNLVRIIKSIG